MSVSTQESDGEVSAKGLAAGANYSVAQYYRRFRQEHSEQPIRQRRRLLLERAAYELTRQDKPVAEIALRANFRSFEGFSRAFRRAYGVSPTKYRSLGATDFRLRPNLAVHFAPGPTSDAPWQGEFTMNVLDRLIGAHQLNMNAILDRVAGLTDEQLDRDVEGYFEPLGWMPPVQSLRTMLRIACGAPGDSREIEEMRRSLVANMSGLSAEIAGYEKDKLWDMTFVDAGCEPPQVFSYGGWIGHLITGHIYRRVACLMALRQLGIDGVAFGGPNEYDAALAQV